MKPYNRLILGIIAFVAYFVLWCFVWLESSIMQLIGLGFILLYGVLAFKPRGMAKRLKTIVPFVFFLALVYGIFALWQIGNSTAYWLHFGITRTALLVSTLLFMQILISGINMNGFLDFPLPIQKLKYIILGNLLYKEATESFPVLCVFLSYVPTQQCGARGFFGKLQNRLIALLALLSYIIHEAALKGEMIDKCIKHCHNDIPESFGNERKEETL